MGIHGVLDLFNIYEYLLQHGNVT